MVILIISSKRQSNVVSIFLKGFKLCFSLYANKVKQLSFQ